MKTLTILLTLFFATVMYAEIINVPADFETIQGGIDASEDGDTVLVAPGEYVENISTDGKTNITIASLTISTGDPAYVDSTIIDGGGEGVVVNLSRMERDGSVTLQGFTIRNGNYETGGGILASGAIYANLLDLYVTENQGNVYAGITAHSIWDVHLRRVMIVNNNGLGIFIGATRSSLEDCEIINNQWVGGVMGAQELSLTNVAFLDNELFGLMIGPSTARELILDHVTIAGTRMVDNEGGTGLTLGTADDGDHNEVHVSLSNSIIYANQGNAITLHSFENRDEVELTVSFSDVEGGEDGVGFDGEAELHWQEGNIDEDPLFADPDNSDYYLTEDSPCKDTGDPDSPEDPDSTRADMGCYPFFHGFALLEGQILRVIDNQPIEGATLSTSYGFTTLSDENGNWEIQRARLTPFDLTASFDGNIDSTINDLQLEFDDTLYIAFNLRYSNLIPSEDDFASELETGDSTSFDFSIRNDGNGALEWSVSPGVRERPDPWQLRETIPVGDIVDDTRIRGVVLVNNRYYVSGGGRAAFDDNFIYVLSLEGELLDSYSQLGQSNYGMSDLAWDGELIWGTVEDIAYGFNAEGDSITSFECPVRNDHAIAWDSDRELLWIAGRTSNYIIGYDLDGNEIDRLNQFDLMIYGLAYFPEDPDGYSLYVTHRIAVPDGDNYQALYKIDTNENDTMFVAQQYSENGELGGKPEGIFLTDQFDLFGWVMMSIANNSSGDRLDIWQVTSNNSWMRIQPESGTINPDEQAEVTLTLDATDLAPMEYPGEIRFVHNGFGGEISVAVDLTVSPLGVSGDDGTVLPIEFAITGIYPNPFNSSTTINYSIPTAINISLGVYNLLGQRVQTLVEGQQQAGDHRTILKGNDLSSGLYFVKLSSDNQSSISKIMLVK